MAQTFATNFWHRMAGSISGRSLDPEQYIAADETPEVGDKYAQAAHGAPVWIVENVLNVTASRYPLVRLTRENHPDLMKIVSLSTLADKQEFTRA